MPEFFPLFNSFFKILLLFVKRLTNKIKYKYQTTDKHEYPIEATDGRVRWVAIITVAWALFQSGAQHKVGSATVAIRIVGFGRAESFPFQYGACVHQKILAFLSHTEHWGKLTRWVEHHFNHAVTRTFLYGNQWTDELWRRTDIRICETVRIHAVLDIILTNVTFHGFPVGWTNNRD